MKPLAPYRQQQHRACCLPAFAALLAMLWNVAATADEQTISLHIEGAGKTLAANIRAHIALGDLTCDTPELHLRSKLKGAEKTIAEATRALGYYQAQWRIEQEQQGKKGQECREITVHIDPGPRATVSQLDVAVNGDGASHPVFTDYLANLPVAIGDPLNHRHYEAIKNDLQQRALNAGYLDGRFERKSLRVNTRDNSASFILHYDTGPRYLFGQVTFNDTPLDESFVRHFMPFTEGGPFNTRQLIQFQSNLINANYFDSVDVEQGEPDRTSHRVPITVTLSPRSRYQTSVGIGFSTDIGPRVSYGLDNRRVNSRGDTYTLSSQWSPVDSNIGFSYTQPGQDPTREKRVWSTGWQQEDTDTAESTSYTAEVAQVNQLDNLWLRTLSLKYLYEEYDFGSDQQSSMLLMPGINYSRSKADNPRLPRKGWRLSSSVRGAYKGVVSDISMAQMELDGKLIRPFFKGRLLTRASLATTAVDEFTELPASLRYFAGGDNSIRGWAYESLGPTNSAGDVIGGKHRVTASVEVDYPVWKDYGAALFYDTGSAFETDSFKLYESVGVGARWFSPIGPIRVDFAFPLDNGGFRLHFSMGPDL